MGEESRFRRWARIIRPDPRTEVDEELAFHLEQRAREYEARGMDPDEARAAARERLGALEAVREECADLLAADRRSEARRDRLAVSWLDFKLGLRMLAKHPGLTVIGGLGLAVGIAISVAFFAVLHQTLYPTLPLEDGERIVALENRDVERNNEDRRVLHDFLVWRDELRTVEDLGAFRTVDRNLIPSDGPPLLVEVAEMTASGFSLARVPPSQGRWLLESDERPSAPHVVVIGHDAWQAHFGGDPDIVGRDIRLGVRRHTIVGVMPEGFLFPEKHQYWVPLKVEAAAPGPREGPEVYVFGRLAPDMTMERAQAELAAVGARAAAEYPESHEQLRPMVMPYTHSLTDVQGANLWGAGLMQGTMTLLLLIVAVNVAVLFYARTARRRGEMAVRSALGASRARIVTQLFVEALVLSLAASVFGLLLAQVGMDLGYGILEAESGGGAFWSDRSLQPLTIVFTIGLAGLTALIIGVVPGLQATGRGLQNDLRQLGGGTGMRLGRTWTALIVAQVAIAVAVLPAVVGNAWSDVSEWTMVPTFQPEEYVVATLWADREESGDAPLGDRLTEIVRRLESEPGVAGVTFEASLRGRGSRIEVEGVPAPPDSPAGHLVSTSGGRWNRLELLDARVVSGRGLRPADAGPEAEAVVVSRSFVQHVLDGAPAVGLRVRHVRPGEEGSGAESERWFEIVGVVENLYVNSLRPDTVPPALFYAASPEEVRLARIMVRLGGADTDGVARRIREVAVDVDPTLRLGSIRSVADERRQDQLATRLVTLAVVLVLLVVFLLSAAGIYALTSFTVTRRRREIGIRAALGASRAQVLGSIFSRAGMQIALGVGIGCAIALVLDVASDGRMLAGRGVVLLPAFSVIMGIVALIAAWGPARRGVRIEPTEALRAEA